MLGRRLLEVCPTLVQSSNREIDILYKKEKLYIIRSIYIDKERYIEIDY